MHTYPSYLILCPNVKSLLDYKGSAWKRIKSYPGLGRPLVHCTPPKGTNMEWLSVTFVVPKKGTDAWRGWLT